jgi:hypothetical protein
MRKVRKRTEKSGKKRNSLKISKFEKQYKKVKHCFFISSMLTQNNACNKLKNFSLETLFTFMSINDKLNARLVCKYWNDSIKSTLQILSKENFLYLQRKRVLLSSSNKNTIFEESDHKKFSKKSLMARYINSNNLSILRKNVDLGILTKPRNINFNKEN